MKAFYLRGKAHMEVWNEAEARADFMRVLDLDPRMKKTIKKELAVLKMRMELKNEEDRLRYKGMFTKISGVEETPELETAEQEIPERSSPEEETSAKTTQEQKSPDREETSEEQTNLNQASLSQTKPSEIIVEQTQEQMAAQPAEDVTPEPTTIEQAILEETNLSQPESHDSGAVTF